MAEILVKTITRHRDSKDPLYLKDWTAGDVLQIAPDGFFTKNKYKGAKRMGIVLKVDGDIPKDYAAWKEDDGIKIVEQDGRCKRVVDLTKIGLTDTSNGWCALAPLSDIA